MYKVIRISSPISYESAFAKQMEAFEQVKNKEYKGIVFILQHLPTYTVGTDGGLENLLHSREFYEGENIDIVETKRGGNITFHGPGQLVVYPILDLTELKKDVHWYIQSLEECVIRVLDHYNIPGGRKAEYRGAWVDNLKIAAVGVGIKRWVTFHGLAFNINVDKKYFHWINPCGIKEFGICALEDYVSEPDIEEVSDQLITSFEEVFNLKLHEGGKL